MSYRRSGAGWAAADSLALLTRHIRISANGLAQDIVGFRRARDPGRGCRKAKAVAIEPKRAGRGVGVRARSGLPREATQMLALKQSKGYVVSVAGTRNLISRT
jgi:hypothetical protein